MSKPWQDFPMPADRVPDLVRARLDELTPAERRVADVVVSDPEAVAFGTVATVAAAAGASGATVVRLAARLGFDGFAALQDAVQSDLARRLRPATERIREPVPGDTVGRVLQASLDAVHGTLDSVDREAFADAVARLADRAAQVWVVCGDASHGIGEHLTAGLSMLRPDVAQVDGSPVRVAAASARVRRGDVVVALDLRRYDRWLLEWVGSAKAAGAALVVLTDSAVSPLADLAAGRGDHLVVVVAESAGPFDTYVGALALLDALVAGVAAEDRRSATESLDRIEAAWQAADVLTDGR
jgi:DNA-binding MurR/RpiR family transcriptional regulator